MAEKSRMDELRAIAEEAGLDEGATDALILYDMQQDAIADEILAVAVGQGIPYALKADGEVYLNVKWIGTIINVLAETVMDGKELPDETMRLVETLSNSLSAASKFVGDA